MKLFGWMHQKIRQHGIDPFKDFTIGNCCTCLSHRPSVDEFYSNPSYFSKPLKHNNHSECQLSISDLNIKVEEQEEVFSETVPEYFHGFLAIGTLGSRPILSEPATPTFGVPSGNIVEKETEVTANELKVINDELDKFLEAEAKEVGYDESGRNSYLSVATLCSKKMEETDSDENGKLEICPLQGYLLRSSVELPDSRIAAKKEKASLEEIIQTTKIAEEYSKLHFKSENEQAKEMQKSNVTLMKKMLKKLQISSRGSGKPARNDASHSVSKNNKIHKVLQKFHRRIHPETLKATNEVTKLPKHEINSTHTQSCYDNDDFSIYDDNKRFPHGFMPKEGSGCHRYIYGVSRNGVSSSSSNGNRERWIKTDADYLILEL